MSERARILIALVQEVLGPRNGSDEVLPDTQNPRDEYITGVLAPENAVRPSNDIEADVDELVEETSSEEDQDAEGFVGTPGVFSPALDPKAQPRSIGLSFTVEGTSAAPKLEICATWARYYRCDEGWKRHPDAFLTGQVLVNRDYDWLAAPGVSICLRSKLLADERYRISLFLVNITEIEQNPADTSEYLFQPQLRVRCFADTCIVPVQIAEIDDLEKDFPAALAAEDASLDLLYRERVAMARGHLCGVTWRDIDPERPHNTLQLPDTAPFAWTDAGCIPENERTKFSPADVRTEMVPCYPVEVPQMELSGIEGAQIALDPEILAETWEPNVIRFQLQPMVDTYDAWIDAQESLIANLSTYHQLAAENNIWQCKQASLRMRDAIDMIAVDDDVRMAFCFANKAIALQSRWTNNLRSRPGQVLRWRPFQLAFILLNLPALVDPLRADRNICDLLWFPTGGGKTEAYLGLAAFTLALRRRRAMHQLEGDRTGAGTTVLSRYTLRLLTIQQFRRALGVITACEMLRVSNPDTREALIGWRPQACPNQEKFPWGGVRFAAGLWVGGNVTPNRLISVGPIPGPGGKILYVGALDILQGASKPYNGSNQELRRKIDQANVLERDGDPAQVLNCPCCGATLAVSDEGFTPGQYTLHFVFQGGRATTPLPMQLIPTGVTLTVDGATITPHGTTNYRTISLTFTISGGGRLDARQVDDWWYQTIAPALGQNVSLMAARPARPGYFILTYENMQDRARQCDFDIYCPNPRCDLRQTAWAEQVPLNRTNRSAAPKTAGQLSMLELPSDEGADLPVMANMQWQDIPPWFRQSDNSCIADRIPIPALTIDDQIYHRCPSMVIATVDKFARLAFEPKAATLFGNVDHYHSRWGYYRSGCPPSGDAGLVDGFRQHPPDFSRGNVLHQPVSPFQPPDLILQDELHLIEGPLGSMFGLYETTIDILSQRQYRGHVIVPKYVASTATVRQADPQVQALFKRQCAQFPPAAISADDRFFAKDREVHPLDSERAGRLYIAICAPGKGAQTPIVRIWSSLLQRVYERCQLSPTAPDLDRFYTLVGYFNAIRELAGALSLYRQDIPERIAFQAGANARQLERPMELSGRARSLDLPSLLIRLNDTIPNAQDAVFATSMFGTGVDVDRLGLMVVHGQPKTTASYIQATGRVGRQGGGLVVTFFRASRPRDLDHYEFFTGYHRALYRHVEPITVAPFSPRARERGLGPLAVILLRHARELDGQPVNPDWKVEQRLSGAMFSQACRMRANRYAPEVEAIPRLLETRASQQPDGRRPPTGLTDQEAQSELDRWNALAGQYPDPNRFVYAESALIRTPERHVVLGDAQHRAQGLSEVYENAPQSLREVEDTTVFRS